MDGLLGAKLLSRGDSLEEMRCVVGVLKQQPQQTIVGLEGMEELAVLVIVKVHVQFVIPHNAAVAQDIDDLEEVGVAHQVVHERDGAH